MSGKAGTYIGLTCGTFKQRYTVHNNDTKNTGNRIMSKLISYIWALKDSRTDHEVNWRKLVRATKYNLQQMQALSKFILKCTKEKAAPLTREIMSSILVDTGHRTFYPM